MDPKNSREVRRIHVNRFSATSGTLPPILPEASIIWPELALFDLNEAYSPLSLGFLFEDSWKGSLLATEARDAEGLGSWRAKEQKTRNGLFEEASLKPMNQFRQPWSTFSPGNPRGDRFAFPGPLAKLTSQMCDTGTSTLGFCSCSILTCNVA